MLELVGHSFIKNWKDEADYLFGSHRKSVTNLTTQGIYTERVSLLYQNGKFSTSSLLVLCILLSSLMYGNVSNTANFTWLVGFFLATSIRLGVILRYLKSPTSATSQIWAKRYMLTTIPLSIGWAWFVLTAFGKNDWLNVIVVLISIGMGSIAVPVLAGFPLILLIYCAPAILLTILLYFMQLSLDYTVLALGTIIYSFLIIRTANNFFETLMTSLHLRFEKEALAADLNQQKENAEQLNKQLKQEVLTRREVQRSLEEYQQNLEKQVEQRTAELQEAKEAAEAGSRAKSEFLANMSHEIRTPLNGVIGATQLLFAAKMEPKEQHYLQIVHESATNLLRLINDLLDFAKIESGQLVLENEDFDLIKLCNNTLHSIEPQLHSKGLTLVFDPSNELPVTLRGDAFRLRQILLNLLGNAIKFTEQGKVELILTARKREDNHYLVGFTVRDSGIGIEANAQESIFSPFTQEDGSITRRFGGSGLGLSITHNLVDVMGGIIRMESTKGVGSTFYVELPFSAIEQQNTTANVQNDALTTLQTRFSGRILLAEDNPINQLIARDNLETLGFEVDSVDDGLQAQIACQQKDYRLILMDCHMPEMDGFDATRAIRQDEQRNGRARIPIIALTADAQQGTRARCEMAGMDDYMTKPFTLDLLTAKIQNALRSNCLANPC